MYISELDLHGFKSFAHKTKVKFDSGITAIVGPNGCGKSNIVDALRWVLGEQRPTLLRSSSMSNVIFNGTAQKKALGMAEVSLTLVNNKGVLPTEYSEVTITRRLYRSGESEYQLNNTACRLKDIMELFMDTGMGSDAYSVIELKMVEEILNDKNNDRRRLFEEAAGVTRYKEKRRQTFRKLDETLKDLQRIEDILVEVRKKARSLELQAEKAVRHRNFRKELEQLDKAYTKGEYLNVQEELNPLQERVDHAAKEKKEIQSALDKLEENEEQIRQKLLEKERTESETRKRVNQVENSARDLETTLKITREKIENEKGVIHRYREDVKQSHTDLKELTKLKDQHGNKLEDLTREVERSEASLKESRKSFNDIQQTYTQIRHQLYELEIESGNTNQRLSDLRADRIRLESRLENTEGDLNRILSDIREFESEISTLQEELTLIENQKREKEEECQRQKSHLEEQSQKRIRLADSREELKETIRTLKSEGDALRSEQQLLQELANSKEFFPTGVAWLMEHHAGSFKRLDVVGNVLHTDEEHAAALESALGESIHYVLVESMEDALRAAELLKKHKQGRATFIPVSELQKSYPVEKSSILGVVNVDNSYMPVAQLLLGSTILAENISQAKRLLPAIDNATSAVTAEGDILFSRSFYRSGSRGQQSGARLGLKDKLEKLELAIEGNKSELKKKDRTLQKLEQELEEIDLDKLRGRLESAEGELRKKEQAAQRIQSNIQHYKKSIGDLQNRQESLTTSESSARNELETLNPREDELRQEIQELNRLQEEKKEQLQKLEDERAIAQNRYNDARLSHQDVENQSENLKKDLKRTENGIVTIHQRLKSREELTRQSEKKISEFNLALEKAEESLSVKRQQQTELADQLREAEKRTQQQRGEIRDLEVELKKLRRKKEVNLELHHHLEMAREKLEMQAQSLSDHI
ncbi:MAG: chromosome segregation protein SMC, partial [Balneolaceae bacterium]